MKPSDKISRNRKRRSDGKIEQEYEIGYGKPPEHTRFQPGQSGNPKGRPKGRKNVSTIVNEVLHERITAQEGSKVRSMSRLEAIIRSLSVRAMKGDAKACDMVVNLAEEYGRLSPQDWTKRIIVEHVNGKEINRNRWRNLRET